MADVWNADGWEAIADEGYAGFELYKDGSLEIDATYEGRYGDEFTRSATVKYTPEQAITLLTNLQAWIEQLNIPKGA